MIAFGCVVGDEARYAQLAGRSIARVREADSRVVLRRGEDCIHRAYNRILAELCDIDDLEAVVLLHEDVEITDDSFLPRVRAALTDPEVAIVGALGASNVRSMALWEGDQFVGEIGWDWLQDPELEPYVEPEALRQGPGGEGECEVVDGALLVLSASTTRELRFDEQLGPSFHGYDTDLCFQARAAGRRVLAARLPLTHHVGARLRSRRDYQRVHAAFAEKWGL